MCVYPEVPRRIRDLLANLPPNQTLARVTVDFSLKNWQKVEEVLLVKYGIGPQTVRQFRQVLAEWFPGSILAD